MSDRADSFRPPTTAGQAARRPPDRPAGGSGSRPGRRRAAAGAAVTAITAVLALLVAGAPAYAATAAPAPTVPSATPPAPAKPPKSPPPAKPPRKRLLPPLPQDLSGTLPNLNYGEAVGDFTGAGHDQRAYAQNSQLNIADVNKFGGQVVSQVPTDLRATPNDGFGNQGGQDVWQYINMSEYEDNGATYGLTTVKVAASASNIFMAGATWNGSNGSNYQLHLYELPHNGSCASASCAEKTAALPGIYDPHYPYAPRLVVATSLAVGVVGGKTLIAVGLSDEGILIFNDSLQQVASIADIATGGGDQTPVTALAFGPPSAAANGSAGSLVGGVESPVASAFTWQLKPDGTELFHSVAGINWGTSQVAMGAASAQVNDQAVSVFTRSDGDVVVFNPVSGALVTDLQPPGSRAGQPTGLTVLTPPPWAGDPGNQELVVGKLDGTTDQVLQYVNGKGLTPVAFGPGGATTGTADQVYAWFPGYAAGRLQVADDSAGPVTIAMASRPDPEYGCWLQTAVTQPKAPAFPAADTPLAAGAVSADYLAGALTIPPPSDPPPASCMPPTPGTSAEWATYVIIVPAGDRADEHIVKLTASADGRTLSIDSQVGGYLTASLSRVSSAPESTWGTWQLALTGGSTPQAAAPPAVQGFRLTAAPDPANYQPPATPQADDPCRPVYRFDVTGATWTHTFVPAPSGQTGQVTARIPAMTAQGSSDGGKTWQDLGQLMPSTAPAVSTDGTVTLGPASFFFQNPPHTATAPGADPAGVCKPTGNTPPVTEVRVMSGGLASSPVTLADPAAPPENGGTGATPIQGVSVTPTAPGGTAAPRADGVDQATLGVVLTPASSGGIIPTSDPRYQLIYYRQPVSNDLVTGLYQPGDYSGYTAVGPQQGPYASPAGQGEVSNYLVTTTTATQSLAGVINDSGTASGALTSSAIPVAASGNGLNAGGTATGGIEISGCASSPCTLADPAAAPALYQAGGKVGGPVTGLLLAAVAVTDPAYLPLQVGTGNTHGLGSASLTVTGSQAQLPNASSFWPTDHVNTALAAAGDLVPVQSVPVGNGG